MRPIKERTFNHPEDGCESYVEEIVMDGDEIYIHRFGSGLYITGANNLRLLRDFMNSLNLGDEV